MARKKKITLQMIADQLGVTVHTVSKGLRGLPGMSEATRRDIFRTARELGYMSKGQAAGLTAEQIPWAGAGKPRRFVMLLQNAHPFYSVQVEGLHQRLDELGHVLTTIVLPNPPGGEQQLMEWLERSGVLFTDGLFLPPALPEWVEAVLLQLPLPKVMINFPPDAAEVDSVIWDVQHAVHLAMNVLHAHGHRSILFVGGIHGYRGFQLRWQAFIGACERLGLQLNLADHVTETKTNQAGWMGQLADKLRRGGYTAVLCATKEDAAWTYAVLQSAGIAVPGSVSVVGTDHEENPSLPELSRPLLLVREVGERAAELMLRRIANPQLPFEHVRLAGAFFAGATLARSLTDQKEMGNKFTPLSR
ncbi:MAG: hypothetical protein K0R57_5837 [Paenibacillaceae bacterium]|jgi:LacI family transcriptional regulator|nr:hypothetical protein [Paenibacillaceae bacterium]